MTQWYGNLTNRLEEGKNYKPVKTIEVGDDITVYSYSDRDCYYVTQVVNEKHIFVKPYHVCADHSKTLGMGHQDWLYFKTRNEENAYLRQYFPNQTYVDGEDKEEEWVFRYGAWRRACHHTPADIQEAFEEMKAYDKEIGRVRPDEKLRECAIGMYATTQSDIKKLSEGKPITTYRELSGKISIGIRDYYYDWEF